jgi:tRNA(Ile)-lysidine synthase
LTGGFAARFSFRGKIMPMNHERDLTEILRGACGLDPAQPVLAGISGGPDSLCLLEVLRRAGTLVIVAHFNHKLRPESDQEAASVFELAQRLGLPFVTDSADVRAYADEHHLSVEESARTLRYRFLFSAARTHHAQAVAVGHTADDQVETVLMHFLRGAALSGLKGMEYRTLLPVFDADIPLVRPLLAFWRDETESYCRAHRLDPHYDASNADQVYFRNRLRHALIPELEKYNLRFKESLLRTAQALQGDHVALQEILDGLWRDIVVETGDGWVAFDGPKLAATSRGLRRNLVRRAGELLRPESRDFGFDALNRAAAFAELPAAKQVDFANGLYLFAESGKIYLAAYEVDLPSAHWPQVEQSLAVSDQQVELGNGWVLSLEHIPLDTENWLLNTDPWSAWLDADLTAATGRLTVRPRRAGDKFAPFGMKGQSIKVQDFFINVKLPQRARANWPLVCVEEEVVWVPGFRIAHRFRVTERTKRVVRLTLKKR